MLCDTQLGRKWMKFANIWHDLRNPYNRVQYQKTFVIPINKSEKDNNINPPPLPLINIVPLCILSTFIAAAVKLTP